MPTKNINQTDSASGQLSLRTHDEAGEVALQCNDEARGDVARASIYNEADFVAAVLEYAHERRILSPLLKAMPQRQRKPRTTTKRKEKKAA